MNHTHYLIIDEDKRVFAIVPRNPLSEDEFNFNRDKVKEAIQQELDEEVISYSVIVVDKNERYNFHARMKDGYKRVFFLQPTWEYAD